MTDEVKVEQIDREHAVEYERLSAVPLSEAFAASILRGECDADRRVQFFARVRLATRPAPAEDAVERVAKAMFDACMAKRYADLPQNIPAWPPSRELQAEWLGHARTALAAMQQLG